MMHVHRQFPNGRCIRRGVRALTSSSSSGTSNLNRPPISNPLPASFLRGGTSKGIFLNRKDLSSDRSEWTPIFLRIMGSPDPKHGRQLNGMGGGVSSLSKICVVGEPTETQKAAGIQVKYTFAQIGVREASVDYSGNCGNLSSMIGVYAVDAGLCVPTVSSARFSGEQARGTVRSFNANTGKIIDTTFPVNSKTGVPMLDIPQTSIAGVEGKASHIDMEFVDPAGARTGKLLPTGNAVDYLSIQHHGADHRIRASLVDATNPSVFILADDLSALLGLASPQHINYGDPDVELLMEDIRQRGAEAMHLGISAKAQPKIATLSNAGDGTSEADMIVNAFSMGVLHRAIPMTLGLCLGVASQTKGTLAWDVTCRSRKHTKPSNDGLTKINHPSGIVEVGASISAAPDGSNVDVHSAKVVRTGRRLMQGHVWW